MAWRIGSSTGTPLFLTNLRLAWGEDKAMAYFDKLKDQKIVNFGAGSARTLVDRVIAGEYAIALNIFAHHPLISKGKGAPVNSQLMDPVASTAATMSVVKGAAPSLCGDAAGRLHPVQGRAGDLGARRIFSGRSGGRAAAGAWRRWCPRSPACRKISSAPTS